MVDPTASALGQSPAGTGVAVVEEKPAGDNGAAGATDTGWYEALPAGLKAEKSLEAFKDKPISAVVESYVNAQKLVGGSLRIPTEKDTPEERAAKVAKIHEANGRPASVDKYVVKPPAAAEMGISWDDKIQGRILAFAHKHGLNNEQAQDAINLAADLYKGEQPDYAADFEACMKELENGSEGNPGWGSTTKRFLSVANRTVSTMFPPEVMDQINRSGLGNSPSFLRGMYRIGKELMEDGVIFPEVEGAAPGNERTAAQAELDKLIGDPKSAYFDTKLPDHDAAVQKALDLRRFLAA